MNNCSDGVNMNQASPQVCSSSNEPVAIAWIEIGVAGLRSGESARLPLMCPGFYSRTWARFSKAPETFRTRETIATTWTLRLQKKFQAYTLLHF